MQLANNVRSREVPVTVQPWMRLARCVRLVTHTHDPPTSP